MPLESVGEPFRLGSSTYFGRAMAEELIIEICDFDLAQSRRVIYHSWSREEVQKIRVLLGVSCGDTFPEVRNYQRRWVAHTSRCHDCMRFLGKSSGASFSCWRGRVYMGQRGNWLRAIRNSCLLVRTSGSSPPSRPWSEGYLQIQMQLFF